MKRKVLFILHLPEPVHGAALMGKFIKESTIINNSFDTNYINLTTSKSLKQLGRVGIDKFFRFLKIQINVIKALSSKRYDLSYITITAKGVGFYKDFFTVCILKLFRKKIIYHFHNKGISTIQHKKFDDFLYRFAFNNTKSILLSPSLFPDIKKYVRKEDVFFCPLGIARSNEAFKNRKEKVEDGPFRILFLSNIMSEKGVFVLLQACKVLKEKSLNFECHFVGAWYKISEAEFFRKVSDYDLTGQVFAHGKKYGKDKVNYFLQADIFVFPTYYHNECFPIVLLEAMEFGLPIISTFEGGIPDIVIDGKTGFLVPQKNVDALAEKLELLLLQPMLCKQMGASGRKRYETHFTLETYENNMKTILEKAIDAENA